MDEFATAVQKRRHQVAGAALRHIGHGAVRAGGFPVLIAYRRVTGLACAEFNAPDGLDDAAFQDVEVGPNVMRVHAGGVAGRGHLHPNPGATPTPAGL